MPNCSIISKSFFARHIIVSVSLFLAAILYCQTILTCWQQPPVVLPDSAAVFAGLDANDETNLEFKVFTVSSMQAVPRAQLTPLLPASCLAFYSFVVDSGVELLGTKAGTTYVRLLSRFLSGSLQPKAP